MAEDVTPLARRVKELREAAGLSQQALAVLAGLSVSVVSQIERGAKDDIKFRTALALARALGVPAESLAEEPPARPRRRKGGGR